MAPNRNGVLAAVCAWAVSAGTIASSMGSAIAAPKVPRRNVRRDRCFFVMIMAAVPSLRNADSAFQRLCDSARGFCRFQPGPHLEWRALDDALDDGFETVIIGCRFLDNAANDEHIRWLDASTQGVGHQPLGENSGERFRPAEDRISQRDRSVDLRAVGEHATGVYRCAGFRHLTPRTD